MKILKWVLVLTVILSLGGCLAISINSFYTKGDLIQDERIQGQWVQVKEKDSDDSGTGSAGTTMELLFESSGASGYDLALTEGDKTNLFEAKLFLLNDLLYLDLYPQLDALQEINSYFSNHLVKAHSLARVQFIDEQLQLDFMDSDNLKKIILRKKLKIEYTMIPGNDDQVLLTGQTEEIRKLITKYAADLFNNKPLEFAKKK